MFNFRLQSILDIRKSIEEKTLIEFSEQQMALLREQDRLLSIEKERGALVDALRDIQGKTVSIDEITLNTESIKQCRISEAHQQERIDEVAKKVDFTREALLEAVKKRKTMETLKDDQFEQYQFNVGLRERVAVDEMNIVHHNRRTKR